MSSDPLANDLLVQDTQKDLSDSPTPSSTDDAEGAHRLHGNRLVRWVLVTGGFLFVGIGILGLFVPGLPTTVFILIAAWCWAKSSRRFHAWLVAHRVFGPMIISWEERRAMPRFAKYMAWGMMAISTCTLALRLPADKQWITGVAGVFCLAVSLWMYRLPDT